MNPGSSAAMSVGEEELLVDEDVDQGEASPIEDEETSGSGLVAAFGANDFDRPWPAEVPRNYEELFSEWGKYIANLVSRYNKVDRNGEELLQWIWEKLCQSNLLVRYVERLYAQFEIVTAEQACGFLGIKWGQWKKRMWRFHKGEPLFKSGAPLEENGSRVRRRTVNWMPTPIAGGYLSRKATIRMADIIKIQDLIEEARLLTMNTQAGSRARKVFLQTEEIIVPIPKSTAANFAGYLRRAVRNHFCNFVRHKERKEKERLHDHFFCFTNRLEQNEGAQWEDLLVEENDRSNPEVLTELYAAIAKVREHIPAQYQEPLFELLVDNNTLFEAIKKLPATDEEKRVMVRSLAGVLKR